MNEDQIKSQIGSAIPTTEDHPLHMLDNQVDPETKPQTQVFQKNIRTYESDIAEALRYKNASIITMAVAETEKRQEEPAPPRPKTQINKKAFLLVVSLILIVSGLGGGYYLYLKSPLAVVPVVQPTKTTSVVSPDITQQLNLLSLEKDRLIQFLSTTFRENRAPAGKITEFIPVQISSDNTSIIKLSGSSFLNSAQFDITDTLKRSLLDKWMMGTYSVYSDSEQPFPFIIFTTDFFQNAYAGMLKWESTMPDELATIFNYKDIASRQVLEDPTATSSRISSFYNIRGKFEDKTISNRDVREFINEDGTVLLLYTFIDKNTLLITTSEEVIPAMIERIEKQTYLR